MTASCSYGKDLTSFGRCYHRSSYRLGSLCPA